MSDLKKPTVEANRLSKMLNQVLGEERFPVKVEELALEYSAQCFPNSRSEERRVGKECW